MPPRNPCLNWTNSSGFPSGAKPTSKSFSLFVEIKIGVVGEERTINRALLQPLENLSRSGKFLWSCGIVAREQQRRDAVGNRSRNIGGVLVGEHNYGDSLVGKDDIF